MDKEQAAADIIAEALHLVPFEGWTMPMLEHAAEKAGYRKTDAVRVFPGGSIDAVDRFSVFGDMAFCEAIKTSPLEGRMHERIAAAVRLRISLNAPYREALRKAIAVHAMPFYAWRGLRALYHTVDTIWRAVGDTSTDTSFYTKRLTLAGVYSATLLHWLDDKSPENKDSWAFLDRRLRDVLAFGKWKNDLLRRRA